MAERRKGGRKNKTEDVPNKLTKEEDAIARFVRFNCPTKETMFEGNEVHYFPGNKAVDTLLESKKYGTKAKQPKFTSRQQVLDFMQSLLDRGLFFRAKKLVLKKKEKPEEKKPKEAEGKSPKPKGKRGKREEELKEEETAADSGTDTKKDEKDKKEEKEDKDDKKKKKKVRLSAHDVQIFLDTSDVYVWIFDPTPLFKKIIGLLMVLGTIAGCLFPLWPDWLRLGVYYLSVAGIAAFGLLIGVALARTILFGIIWAATMGKHKLWLLPNLMEDCGFWESFQPLYTYEYCPPKDGESKEDKKKSKKKSGKTSDDESKDEQAEDIKDEKAEESPSRTTETKADKKSADEEDKSEDEDEGNKDEDASDGSDEEKHSNPSEESDASQEDEERSDVSSKADEAGDAQGEQGDQPRRRRARARRDDDGFVLVNGS